MTIFLLIDDYTPDAGSEIHGVYLTKELAQKQLDYLESNDNE